MENENNNQKKLPVPKHLTQKEKANLMVAWARTHNKIDFEARTITYPSGAVGKLKPKKEEQQETPPQEAKEDNEPIVSKMEQMTPKERANHDFKFNLLKKAIQMSKEGEQNKKEALQPNLFAALEKTDDIKPKTETKETTEKFRDEIANAKLDDFIKDPREELGTLRLGVNPMVTIKAAKVISVYIEAGIYKLSDIVDDLHAKYNELSKQLFDAIKQGYASFRETADDDTYAKLDKNTRYFSYEFFINKFKMEQPQLTTTETLGRKHLMKFLENMILNFKSKNVSSESLMGLTKAYYLLDNYKKITYEGYLRLDVNERDEEGDLDGYVFRIYSDKAILSYEGYTHGSYGGDSVYEEMFNFDYDYSDFGEPEVNIRCWTNEFEKIFNNTGSFSIDDSTDEIAEISDEDDDDYKQEDDAGDEDNDEEDYLQYFDNAPIDYNSIETNLFISVKKEFQKIPPLASDDYNSAWDDLIAQYGFGGEEYMLISDVYDNALVKFIDDKFNCLNQDDKQFLKNDYSNNNEKSNLIPDDIIISEIVGRFKLWIEDNFNVDDLEDDEDEDDDEQEEE